MLPLTLVEALGVCAAEELLLQLYAFATFGVAFKLTNNVAIEIAMPNAKLNLFICYQNTKDKNAIANFYSVTETPIEPWLAIKI